MSFALSVAFVFGTAVLIAEALDDDSGGHGTPGHTAVNDPFAGVAR